MKKFTFILSALCLFLVFGCSTENDTINETSLDPNFRVFEYNAKEAGSIIGNREADCITTELIAGQNISAGFVTVTNDGVGNLIITYTTTGDWFITETHMSIGDCEETFPTTGSGNPKVGKFEHSDEHPDGTTLVTYMVNLEALPPCYCFAAHAVVNSPTLGEETAWADGTEFDGNSWAMYVEASEHSACLTECTSGEEELPEEE